MQIQNSTAQLQILNQFVFAGADLQRMFVCLPIYVCRFTAQTQILNKTFKIVQRNYELIEESRPDRQPDRPVNPTGAGRPDRFPSLQRFIAVHDIECF